METNNNSTGPVSQPPVSPKKTNWFDAMHIATYVIVVAGLAVVGWQIYAYVSNQQTGNSNQTNNTTDPTANWKTYSNSQYGFEFKYPANIYVRSDASDIFSAGSTKLPLELGGAVPEGQVEGKDFVTKGYSIGVFPRAKKDLVIDITKSVPNEYTSTKLNLSNITAYRIEDIGGVSAGPEVYLESPLMSDKYIVFNYDYSSVNIDGVNVEQLANQILSTFKFTDSQTTSDSIFQEVSSQLGITKSKVSYFRIYGSDKVQYSLGSGTTFAYKYNNKWQIAGPSSSQDVRFCTDYNNVPEQYRPFCDDNGKLKYADAQNQSINYPPDTEVHYIGQ
jgi:hypothetical protein